MVRHRIVAAAAGVLLAVAALVPAAAGVAAADGTLGVLAISTQQYVGETDLILQLLDADHAPVVDPALDVSVILVAPDGTAHDPIPAEPRRFAVRGRDLWLARVTYDAAGPWVAVVSATGPDGSRTGSVPVLVSPDGATPPLGSAANDLGRIAARNGFSPSNSVSTSRLPPKIAVPAFFSPPGSVLPRAFHFAASGSPSLFHFSTWPQAPITGPLPHHSTGSTPSDIGLSPNCASPPVCPAAPLSLAPRA